MYKNSIQLEQFDQELHQALMNETRRQEEHAELIASENYVSPLVMKLQGSIFTNKYAEGYPSKRYYGGCKYVDIAENLAIERAKKLFSADYANVQPHSGSQANSAVYQAFCNPGDTVLGMSLAHGGHLTHGSSVSFSGRIYNAVHYGIDSNGLIDFSEISRLAREHKPKMIIAGFSAYSRTIDWSKFREIADEVNAKLLIDIAHVAGLVVTGLYPNPVPFADAVTSTTHKTLRGARGGLIIAKKNAELEKALNSRIFPGTQGGPLLHAVAAKAVSFKEALDPSFVDYQTQVIENAQTLSEVLINRGFKVISGGTDIHMFLLSFVKQGLTGKEVDCWLGESNITVNKNSIPNDPQSPSVTSGVRLGTPAVTTRGFAKTEAERLGHIIADVIDSRGEDKTNKDKILELCKPFPVYQ